MCEKEDPKIKQCIDEFISFYLEKMKTAETGTYLSICPVFAKVFSNYFDAGIHNDGKYVLNNQTIKLMKEQYINGCYKFCTYGNLILLNNKDIAYPPEYN
jgi:hypothetical protein